MMALCTNKLRSLMYLMAFIAPYFPHMRLMRITSPFLFEAFRELLQRGIAFVASEAELRLVFTGIHRFLIFAFFVHFFFVSADFVSVFVAFRASYTCLKMLAYKEFFIFQSFNVRLYYMALAPACGACVCGGKPRYKRSGSR
ncbi:MAG: hypothetical protein LRY51_15285 [Geovibrio sp.]|nr:hypothetical protein [Geovibrio sp.]